MNFVEPIRKGEDIRNIENYLKKNDTRNYIMFILGIHSGLRISDILPLRVRDVKNKEYITIRETKTSKRKQIPINNKVKKELKKYCEGKGGDEFLIKSRKGYNSPIQRNRAYQIMKETGEMFGIYGLGTHTLRKTFGYHFYMQTNDIVSLQQFFRHASIAVTLRYIGIEQETINKKVKSLKFY